MQDFDLTYRSPHELTFRHHGLPPLTLHVEGGNWVSTDLYSKGDTRRLDEWREHLETLISLLVSFPNLRRIHSSQVFQIVAKRLEEVFADLGVKAQVQVDPLQGIQVGIPGGEDDEGPLPDVWTTLLSWEELWTVKELFDFCFTVHPLPSPGLISRFLQFVRRLLRRPSLSAAGAPPPD